jgi:hypothetical protein
MNRRAVILTSVLLVMIGAAAAFIRLNRSWQHLGKPGVLVADQPLYAVDATLATNEPFLVTNISIPLPEKVLDFESHAEPVRKMELDLLPKDTTFGRRSYHRTNEPPIACQVVLMGADRSSIHKPQFCLRGTGFTITESTPMKVPITQPHHYDLPVRRLKLRRQFSDNTGAVQSSYGIFVYWFVADGKLTDSHYERVLLTARDLLTTGVVQRWAYVLTFTPCASGQEDAAYERVKEFIAAAAPKFQITTGPQKPAARASN